MRIARYIIAIFILLACYIAISHKPHSEKPTIRIALHNMFPPAPISRNTPISAWPKVIADKIHFFLHPEDRLKEFGMLNEILSEKYNIEITSSNYDIIIDSVFGNEPLPTTRHCEEDKVRRGNLTSDKREIAKVARDLAMTSSHKCPIKIFFTGEAIKPRNPENYDLVMGFDYIDHPNYIRVPLYYMYPIYDAHNIRTDYDRGTCNPHKPYFACFLYSNSGENDPKRFDGAMARNSLFDKLSGYKKVESGGKYRNNIGHMVSREDTMQWMSQCKFVVSYENQTYDGYMTEKPFLSYFAGAVPLYYGDKHAMQDINSKAMIFQGDFAGQDEMVEYIKKVDNDDALYCEIWNERIIVDPSKDYEVVKLKLKAMLNAALTRKTNY